MTAAAPSAVRGPSLPAGTVVLLVLMMASWGFHIVSVRLALVELAPAVQSLYRALLSTGCLTLFMLWRGERPVVFDATFLPGLVVGLIFAVEFLMIFAGVGLTGAARGAIFIYTMPFFVAGLAAIFLPGERLDRLQVAGLTCAFAGVVLAFADGLASGVGSLVGDVMLVGAAFLWAATTMVIKTSALKSAPATRVLWYQLALSIPVSAVAVAVTGAQTPLALSGVTLAMVVYQGVWVAFATYIVWFGMIARHSASVLAAFAFLTPMFGVLFGWLVLGEPVGWRLVAALALVAGGILLVNRRRG